MNVATALSRMAAQRPYGGAVIIPRGRGRDGRLLYDRRTYGQLDRESDRIARGLKALGVGRGMRTVVALPHGFERIEVVFGLLKVGAVAALLDPDAPRGKIVAYLEDLAPEAYVGDRQAQFRRVLFGWGRSTIDRVVTVGQRWLWGGVTLEQVRMEGDAATGEPAMEKMGREDPAFVLNREDPDGRLLGAIHTHGSVAGVVERLRRELQVGEGDVDVTTVPDLAVLGCLLGTRTVIAVPEGARGCRVDPTRVAAAIGGLRGTRLTGSTDMLRAVVDYGVAVGSRLPGLRTVVSLEPSLPMHLLRELCSLLADRARVMLPYGTVECPMIAATTGHDMVGETAQFTDAGQGVCVGKPVSREELEIIGIRDEPIFSWDEASVLGLGEVGEIVVRGSAVAVGYVQPSGAAAMGRIGEGPMSWQRTGDLAYEDNRGRLWLCGRLAHRVETSLGRFTSTRCERVFEAHPHIDRATLVAVRVDGAVVPAMVAELAPRAAGVDPLGVARELRGLGACRAVTGDIETLLVRENFGSDRVGDGTPWRMEVGAWAQGQVDAGLVPDVSRRVNSDSSRT